MATHRYGIVLDDQTRQYLESRCYESGRSIAAEIRWIIREYAREHDPEVSLTALVRQGRKEKRDQGKASASRPPENHSSPSTDQPHKPKPSA